MVQRIESYYGKELGAEEARWVEQNLDGLTAEDCDKFIDVLGNVHRKGRGCPDIASMSKARLTIKDSKKTYFWAICCECGCEYDYRLMLCPKCYEKGYKCTDKEIKVSDCRPPMKVIRYNKTFVNYKNAQGQKEMSCYRCEARELSFCPNFGNPDWNCMEYRNCKCNVCCAMERRANSRMKENKGEKHYAIPLGEV